MKISIYFRIILLVFLFNNILLIQESFAQWVRVNNGLTINQYDNFLSMCKKDYYLFVGTQYGLIFRSTNNGLNWLICDSISGIPIETMCENNGNILLGGLKGIYKSTNNGLFWFPCGLNGSFISYIYSDSLKIYAGTYSDSVFLSTNAGNNWLSMNPVRPNSSGSITGITSIGNSLFVSTYFYGVFLSTNNGISWSVMNNGLSTYMVFTLISNGNNLFAGTYYNYGQGGLFLSTNNGINWVQSGLTNMNINTLAKYQNSIFSGTNYGVYISKNNGYGWITKNEGFDTIPEINYLFATDTYLFALTRGNIWRRILSDILSIKKTDINVQSDYLLYQNYPNPFNPTTNIRYQISNNSFVSLNIYDALGRNIKTLVNEKQSPGTYEVSWDASKYPSGIYFYKLTAGEFSEVRKMILVK